MLSSCYLYKHQKCFHINIHGTAQLLPTSSKENSNLSIQIVKQRLQQDNTLPQRTSMSISQITSLLEFCLTHIYFLFHGKYYEQVQGAAMGSPISPLIANIFMEEFEVQALNSFPHPPFPLAQVC